MSAMQRHRAYIVTVDYREGLVTACEVDYPPQTAARSQEVAHELVDPSGESLAGAAQSALASVLPEPDEVDAWLEQIGESPFGRGPSDHPRDDEVGG